jgi:enoyl-CoA hydratase
MTVLTSQRIGYVTVLTMNRPDALNALNRELMRELNTALEHADADPEVGCVVITGEGRAFCAGADVSELDGATVTDTLAPDGFARQPFELLARYRKPVIAAVGGLALGGGCELALASDIVVAAESAKFGLPEVKLGLMPGAGGTQRLVHAIGKAKAMRLLLTGDMFTAADALTAGLIAEVVPDGEHLAASVRLAERIARNAPLAVQLIKDAAGAAHETILSQGLERERRDFFLLLGTNDMREGVSAFLDKRAPVFTGS